MRFACLDRSLTAAFLLVLLSACADATPEGAGAATESTKVAAKTGPTPTAKSAGMAALPRVRLHPVFPLVQQPGRSGVPPLYCGVEELLLAPH